TPCPTLWSTVDVASGRGWRSDQKRSPVVMGPCVRRDDVGIVSHHGIANRSVLPPLLISTGAKPIGASPRVPQSPCSDISNLLSRVQSSFAPPQFSGLSLCLTARFSPSTASAKL